jgi:hypothetical protein
MMFMLNPRSSFVPTVIMGCIATAALVTMVIIPAPAVTEELVSKPSSLKCDIGPVKKIYGMTQWLVYSCDDHRTVVVVSAPENPAMPFFFTFFPNENGYGLHGEGTGSKEATPAAFEELKALSEDDITALIEQTRQH